MTEYLQSFMPILASEKGHLGDELNGWVHILMLLLMVGWGIFFIYCLFRFNSKSNPKASYTGVTNHYSRYVEIGIVVFEAVLLIGLAIPNYDTVKYDNALDTSKDEVVVRVIAQQFKWNFHYPGPDGKFGKTYLECVNDEEGYYVGVDRQDNGVDDIVIQGQLHLPVNKLVKMYISSKDVIHSFALPEMRVKQDAIPGMQIPIYFKPTITSEEFLKEIKGTGREGRGYEVACAQLCGGEHFIMKGDMFIHEEEDYNKWLVERQEYNEEYIEEEDCKERF